MLFFVLVSPDNAPSSRAGIGVGVLVRIYGGVLGVLNYIRLIIILEPHGPDDIPGIQS